MSTLVPTFLVREAMREKGLNSGDTNSRRVGITGIVKICNKGLRKEEYARVSGVMIIAG
jgi:hypothetical protein